MLGDFVCGDTDNRREGTWKVDGAEKPGGKRNIGQMAETTPQY